MKSKSTKKLALKKVTIRDLSAKKAKNVKGGCSTPVGDTKVKLYTI